MSGPNLFLINPVLYYTKPMLLAIGDKYEEQIAKDRAEDAAYR